MFKKIAVALLAVVAGCSSPSIERDYRREVILRPPDTRHSIDVNTDYSLGVSEAMGYIDDSIAGETDRNVPTRAVNAAASLWVHSGISYLSHEMGHAYNLVPGDKDTGWKQSGHRSIGYPIIKFNNSLKPLREVFYSDAGGLNQNEANAQALWERTDTITLDRAFSFLAFKLDDSLYNFMDDLDPKKDQTVGKIQFVDKRPVENERVYPKKIPREIRNNDLQEIGAIYEYWGLHLGHSGKEIERRAMVADLLTTRTYESIGAIYRYLKNGERSTKPIVFDVAGHKFLPPNISSYLTTRGVFYNSEFGIDGKIFFVGRNTDISDWRVGFDLGDLDVGCFSVSPFGSFSHENGSNGFSFGTDFDFLVGDNLSLVFSIQRSEDDIIDNGVKAVANGVGSHASLKIKW